MATEAQRHREKPAHPIDEPSHGATWRRWVGPPGGPTFETGAEPEHERIGGFQAFAFRFGSGLVRRFAAPIDAALRLRASVSLWPTSSVPRVTSVTTTLSESRR